MADEKDVRDMRAYWDEGARRNALWYVDTSLDFDNPDIEKFFETGRVIVDAAFDGAPVAPPSNDLAVEIGCGLGRICKALAARFDNVIGVDISPEMIARAEKLVQEPNVDFRLGNGKDLDSIDTASVDLVLSFTVFQHIPSVDVISAYIADAGRILKPGGVFVFQWNNEHGAWRWRARRAVLSGLQRARLWPEKYSRHAPQFLGSRVPLDQIRSALASGGLSLAAVNGEGTLYAWAWAQRQP